MLFQILVDPLFLVVRQGVHRVDQDRRQAALIEPGRVLPGVLDHGQQERLRLAAARAGGHDDRPSRGGEQLGDGLGLVQVGSLHTGPLLHHLGELGVDGQLPPRLATLERPMGLVERLLGQEARCVEFGFQCRPQLRVLRPELRPQVVGVFVDDVVEGFDGVKAMDQYPSIPASWVDREARPFKHAASASWLPATSSLYLVRPR